LSTATGKPSVNRRRRLLQISSVPSVTMKDGILVPTTSTPLTSPIVIATPTEASTASQGLVP
jgi:hypothetical protein